MSDLSTTDIVTLIGVGLGVVGGVGRWISKYTKTSKDDFVFDRMKEASRMFVRRQPPQ